MQRPHIIIATPGRLADHIRTGGNDIAKLFSRIRYLVLDEADRLISPGFAPDLVEVLRHVPRASRKTIVMSATLGPAHEAAIQALVRDGNSETSDDALFVYRADGSSSTAPAATSEIPSALPAEEEIIDPDSSTVQSQTSDSSVIRTVAGLRLGHLFMPTVVKDAVLLTLLRRQLRRDSVVVFVSRCRIAALVLALLQGMGVRTTALHSFMTQRERAASLARFKSNMVDILVTTDVGSRGLDIPKVGAVINYDLPSCPTDFVHRVGRTARAGRGGLALSFVTERDIDVFVATERFVGRRIPVYTFDIDDKAVLELRLEVEIAKREALLLLERTGFGTKREINMAKRKKLMEAVDAAAALGDESDDSDNGGDEKPALSKQKRGMHKTTSSLTKPKLENSRFGVSKAKKS